MRAIIFIIAIILLLWILDIHCTPVKYLENGCPAPRAGERKDKTIQERRHPKKQKRTPVYY